MKKILIPVDFQKQSLLALQQSYNLARRINAEIIMLYVHEQSGILASLFSKDQHNELISRIDEKLAELAGKAALISGLKVTYRVDKGRIYTKIAEVAQEIKPTILLWEPTVQKNSKSMICVSGQMPRRWYALPIAL
ncbi:MAG: universal stress protein [Bacteroidales bacterium]